MHDVMPNRQMNIRSAYDYVGKRASRYDGMMASGTWTGRLALRLFWQLSPEDYDAFLAQMFAGLPKDFSGRLLEVPVGTGVLSLPRYRELPKAEITCLDYSNHMLQAARARAHTLGLDSIAFRQGDVAQMPFEDESFDLLLSIDGLHAFPQKDAALAEMHRVLAPDGILTGCTYIRGENAITDLFVRTFCTWRGYFTPPFDTFTSLHERLSQHYEILSLTHTGSFAGFTCRKKELKAVQDDIASQTFTDTTVQPFHITASFGLSDIHTEADSSCAIHRADTHLYHHKEEAHH